MVRRLTYLLGAAAALLLLGNVLLRFGGAAVWDDAYFYARYADHFLEHGSYAWNVGDAAYGLTAPLYGGLVLGTRVFGGDPDLPLLLLSLVGLVATLALGWKLLSGAEGEQKRWQGLYVGSLLVLQGPALAGLATSGMETLWATAYLGAFLLGLMRFKWGLKRRGLIMGFFGGLAFLIRPELLLFTLGVPLGMALLSKNKRERLLGLYMFLFGVFAVIACMVGARTVLGDLLPLSFYAKSPLSGVYGHGIVAKYQWWALREAAGFVVVNGIAFLGMGLAWMLRFKQVWGAFSLLEKLLFGLLAAYMVYESFFVLQVMGGAHRFYYPAWLVVVYLGWRSWDAMLGNARGSRVAASRRSMRRPWVLGLVCLGLVGLGGLETLYLRPPNVTERVGKFGLGNVYAELGQHNWHALDRVSELPDDCVLAATELGILGAMNPEKEVVDLSGLNDREILKGLRSSKGFACDYLLNARRPDLIYLPHPDYTSLREALFACGLESHYLIFPATELQSYLGVAIRKDSQYFVDLKGIFQGG